MNMANKSRTCENGNIEETVKSCEQNTFKKARFAWQIKGQAPAGSSNQEETEEACVQNDCKPEIKEEVSKMENEKKNETFSKGGYSTDSPSDLALRIEEENLSRNRNLTESEINTACSKASEHAHQSSKRKFCSNNETELCTSKRVKSSERSCLEAQSESGITESEKAVNLQSRCSPTTSNPDLGRALSSILPNFNGFDIPSFIWQKQEMGCAIVDNVFNRTIEEMGLSPDPVVNLNASTRLSVENHSIETAIRNQGLRATGPQSEEHRILNNMVEMQRTATAQDFQHTQNRIAMMVNPTQSGPRGNVEYVAESDATNCGIKDNVSSDTDPDDIEETHHSSVVNSNLDEIDISTSPSQHVDSVYKCDSENDSVSRVTSSDDIRHRNTETTECKTGTVIDDSQCKSKTDRHSEQILDLAVSTAILSQGLTLDSV